MKSTGMVRRLDNLGRIVIPIEIRKAMGIDVHDSIEIFAEGDNIILRRYEAGCVFCGEARDTVMLHGKQVCGQCREQLLAGNPTGGA